jgi:hypothetical protein
LISPLIVPFANIAPSLVIFGFLIVDCVKISGLPRVEDDVKKDGEGLEGNRMFCVSELTGFRREATENIAVRKEGYRWLQASRSAG